MRLFDLSLRYKLPLWSGGLILLTAFLLSLTFISQTYDDLRRDRLDSSEALGRTLVKTLYAAVLHDDVWRAFEIVTAPFGIGTKQAHFHANELIVVNNRDEIFVTSHPEAHPLLTRLTDMDTEYARLGAQLRDARDGKSIVVEGAHLLLGIPLIRDDTVLGGLIMVHEPDFFWPRVKQLATRAGLLILLVLAALMPLNWFWGQRMAVPLVHLADRMGSLGDRVAEARLTDLYPYRDELGHLYRAVEEMFDEMADKKALEKQMLQSERLAALGRLASGIAHEINNPLGGLITALDTLRHHGPADPVSQRVLPLLERGLNQIREIVAALLVEARGQQHPLTSHDLEDIHTLLAQEIHNRHQEWRHTWQVPDAVSVPATLVRQILINLLLNASRAAGEGGHVVSHIETAGDTLAIRVENDGQPIPAEVLERLFEPFVTSGEAGHGLGLWMTYQIVNQLHGSIKTERRGDLTCFEVHLPIASAA